MVGVVKMARTFNVTGTCIIEEDYMVDITDKLVQIKAMVDRREYFVINRGRQYGKTTTLSELRKYLTGEYIVISMSFENFGGLAFSSETQFCREFLQSIETALDMMGLSEEVLRWKNDAVDSFTSLSRHITSVCRTTDAKYVLLIDEVDKTSNNVIFLNFLSKLRAKFLARKTKMDFTFHSVILAGVTDIRNIKLKMVQEGLSSPSEGELITYNSPWNIASAFEVDLSFSIPEIAGMLESYEADHHTGMDTREIAGEIYDYTEGYPVLVTGICKNIDEKLDKDWTPVGVRRGVKLLLNEKSPLFESLTKNLDTNKQLYNFMQSMVVAKRRWGYNPDNELINIGMKYGYLSTKSGKLAVANKIFDIRLLNYFTTNKEQEDLFKSNDENIDDSGIVVGNTFNMDVCLEKFAQYYKRYYSKKDERFIEREGRMLFLMFISPVLNGQGFAYIEAQSPDGKRTDVVINYLSQQFVIELKIWDGQKKHEEAAQQLVGYMDRFQTNEGYLLTFDFREKKELKHEWVAVDDKRKILDVVV